MPMVKIENFSKTYAGGMMALNKLNLEVEKGRIFCLLGPNGAGKTTLVKGLLGLLAMDDGVGEIDGVDIRESRAREGVSYLPERFSFYPYYTVDGLLDFYASFYRVGGEKKHQKKDALLKEMGISALAKTKIGKLSKGQLQRAALAAVFLGGRPLVILDEPFSGLDPLGIIDLKEKLQDLKSQGKTVFINTHILGEIESICDDLALINKGRVICAGNKKELLGGTPLDKFFHDKVAQDES